MPPLPSPERTDVFLSFCRPDERWLERLRTMLRPLISRGDIATWDSTRLLPGSDRFLQLEAAIRRARVAVLLVSPDYLADDSIATHELPPLLEAAHAEGLTILWVPVRHSLAKETALRRFQAVLEPSKPLQARSAAKKEEALLEVCECIREALIGAPEPGTAWRQSGEAGGMHRPVQARVLETPHPTPPRAEPVLPVNYVERPRELGELAGYLLGGKRGLQAGGPGGARRLEEGSQPDSVTQPDAASYSDALNQPDEVRNQDAADYPSGHQTRGNRVAITTALHGAGGYGKTTLAQALCRDSRIQQAFPGGILWATLGEHPTGAELLEKLLDLIVQLSGTRPPLTGVEAAADALAGHLADRPMLLVIDDVWRSRDLEPFLRGGPCTTRLITTRNSRLLPDDCLQVAVDAMEEDQALALLSAKLPRAGVERHRAALLELADDRLCRWPLLLGIVNRALLERLKRGQALAGALEEVQKRLELRGLKAFDQDGEARQRAVARTVEVSLELLDRAERARFGELAVYPEDVDVPLEVVARCWGRTGRLDTLEAEDLCLRLHELSLLQRLDLEGRTLRLHDVMREYLRREAGPDLGRRHAALLEALRPASGAWWDLPREAGYLWMNLGEHLEGAGLGEEWRALLCEYRWIQAKLEATEVNALVGDYGALAPGQPMRLVGEALRLSSHVLAREKGQLASQLTGRLLGIQEPEVAALLQDVRLHEHRPWLRPLWPVLDGPGGALIRTLEGHTHEVNAVCALMDGQVVSGSFDGTLKVWEVETGYCLHTFEGHSGGVNAVSALQSGRVISGSLDSTLKVWELETGRCLTTFKGHAGGVYAVTELQSGRVVSGSADGTLKVWDVETGRCLRTLLGHSEGIWTLSVVANERVVSGSFDRTLKVWDAATGQCLHTLLGHSKRITAVRPFSDEQIVSGSGDGTLKVWDLETGRNLLTLRAHSEAVTTVGTLPDGRLVSGSEDNTLKIWELNSGQCQRILAVHSGWVQALIPLPNKRIVSGSWNGTLRVWDLETSRDRSTLEGHSRGVWAVSALPDGRAITGSSDCTLKVWDVETGRRLRTLQGHSEGLLTVNALPNRRVVSGSWDGTLKIWDLETGRCIRTIQGHSSRVNGVCALLGGRLISGSLDGTLKVWDMETGCWLHTLEGHLEGVNAVSVLPDGRGISASDDHTLRVWEGECGHCLRTLKGHSAAVNAVSALSEGRVVSGSDDCTLKVWEVESGRCLLTLEGHSAGILSVSALYCGRVASAGWDGVLKIWEVETGRCVATTVTDAPLFSCAALADGTLIAGDLIGRVHAFRLEEPTPGAV